METIWVTGASGFIGRHLSRYLGSSANKVYGIGHGLWPQEERDAWLLSSWVNGDISFANLNQLSIISGLPDRIYHLAGGSSVGASLESPFEDFNRTVNSTANLLEWLRVNSPKTKLITVSSAAVYGSLYENPIEPTDSTQPFSPYGCHKLMMETLCASYTESYGINCAIVRLFSVYGSWLRKQLLWDLCCKLSKGVSELTLGGSGNELRDWTEITDVVRLLDDVGKYHDKGFATFNGGTGIATPVSRVAQTLVDAWGVDDLPIKFNGIKRPGDPASLVSVIPVIGGEAFNWQVPIEKGIREYVNWYKEAY